MKKVHENILTAAQKVILFALKDKKQKFVRELAIETSFDTSILFRNLTKLKNRGLVLSVKNYDSKGLTKRIYNHFWISEREVEVLRYNQNTEPFEVQTLITKVKSTPKNSERVEMNKRFLGKNQKVLLQILSDGNSYFAKELHSLTHIKFKTVGKSLYMLYNRGFA